MKIQHWLRHLPISSWLLGVPGLLCAIVGALVLTGALASMSPILADSGTGIALLVSAVALLGSAAFPAVIRRLSEQESGPAQ